MLQKKILIWSCDSVQDGKIMHHQKQNDKMSALFEVHCMLMWLDPAYVLIFNSIAIKNNAYTFDTSGH